MADRRMFLKAIVTSDSFLDLDHSAQCLYFQLCLSADDDGFIGSPKGLTRQCGCSESDLQKLVDERFLIKFSEKLYVIKHWRMHNLTRADRHKPTTYIKEFSRLEVDKKGAYKLIDDNMTTNCQPFDANLATQVRLGKDSIGKVSIGKDSIEVGINNSVSNIESAGPENPPTFTDVLQFFIAINGEGKEARKFFSYYSKLDWHDTNGKPIKNWKARAELWHSDQR